jgi:hypothetical protein
VLSISASSYAQERCPLGLCPRQLTKERLEVLDIVDAPAQLAVLPAVVDADEQRAPAPRASRVLELLLVHGGRVGRRAPVGPADAGVIAAAELLLVLRGVEPAQVDVAARAVVGVGLKVLAGVVVGSRRVRLLQVVLAQALRLLGTAATTEAALLLARHLALEAATLLVLAAHLALEAATLLVLATHLALEAAALLLRALAKRALLPAKAAAAAKLLLLLVAAAAVLLLLLVAAAAVLLLLLEAATAVLLAVLALPEAATLLEAALGQLARKAALLGRRARRAVVRLLLVWRQWTKHWPGGGWGVTKHSSGVGGRLGTTLS